MNFFSKKYLFFKKKFESFSRPLATKFRNFGKHIHQLFQIRNLRVHENFKKKSGRTRKAFYVSNGTFRGKVLEKTKFYDIWALSEKLPVSWRKNFSGVFNTAFHVSREALWDKRFFVEKKISLTLFADFHWRISEFLANFFNKRVHTEVFVTRGTFWIFVWRRYNIKSFHGFFLGNFDLQENSRFVN